MYVVIDRAALQVIATGELAVLREVIRDRYSKQNLLFAPADENRTYSAFSTEELRKLYRNVTGFDNGTEDYAALTMSVRAAIELLPPYIPPAPQDKPPVAHATAFSGGTPSPSEGPFTSPVIGENNAVTDSRLTVEGQASNVSTSQVTTEPVTDTDQENEMTEQAAGTAQAPATTEAAPKDARNGVTRPKAGTKTGRVWEITDGRSRELGKPATRKEVIEIAQKEGINVATAATQYGRWRKYFGLGAEPKETPAAASDVTTEGAATPQA